MKNLRGWLESLLNPRPNYRAVFHRGELVEQTAAEGETPGGARREVTWRQVITNFPLVLGGVLVLMLFLVVLFGPLLAPYNPYISGERLGSHYDRVSGEWLHPPLPPSAEYPLGTDEWGIDLYSMLLYGARNTIIASLFITMVRVLLGTILGAYAGWNEGGLADQFVMGAIGVVTAIPMLISSMILIYALDIRRGLPVFIVALAAIGWTEIAQYIRSEFLVIRQMPYIESARAVGSRSWAIAVRHVLPNLLPQLLVITFLEIGAVLMLLGELGFVGVYIGGGSHISLGDEITGVTVLNLAEVPEWGAMLAEGYRWLRARPFVVFPPAVAFFVSVLGFNAFGEGLRRLLEASHFSTGFLLRKRMILVVAALTAATVFIINNTGSAPWFARLARAFDGQVAYDHTAALAKMEGRGPGQPGGEEAAAYIAEKFAEYGLQPGWRKGSYIYPLETRLVQPASQPRLTLLDAAGLPVEQFRYQSDFGFMIEGHGGSGVASGSVVFVGFTDGEAASNWEAYRGLDLSGQIVLLIEDNALREFPTEALIRGATGVLWVAAEDGEVRSQSQASGIGQPYTESPTIPILRMSHNAAARLLEGSGWGFSDLMGAASQPDQAGPGWFARRLPVQVEIEVSLKPLQTVSVPCVIGYLPGSDFELANDMVVLAVNYDGLGRDPDGTVYTAANNNAAGIGVLLELARLWQAQELSVRRSVLFVAWGGGNLAEPGLEEYLQSRNSFGQLPAPHADPPLAPAIIIQWTGAGGGEEALVLDAGGDSRLKRALVAAADEMEIPAIEIPLDRKNSRGALQALRLRNAAGISITWDGAAIDWHTDTLEEISPEKLSQFGQVLSRTLADIVRENRY